MTAAAGARTLASRCQYEEVIKRSRFIAHAGPVASQADSLAFFDAVADHSASHNCWAWRIDGVYRSSDDGEPGGSAGRPILQVLEGRALDRVMVIVTRHFGGIKLGVGGLVRAYSGCAAKCLDRAEFVTIEQRLGFRVTTDHALADTVHRLLKQFGADKAEESWSEDGLAMEVEVDEAGFRPLCTALREASRGRVGLGRPRRL